ncbi:MAG: hydrogenase expression/formation protein HypE [Saprospiraceae bacterium]|jgi:hydrogenase expression/formation protein HypE|nr:hydrogenase expression/formation protein HypE [Saprospiraceae bacterium]
MNRSFQLDCPLPQLDFDRIILGHGSGGILTHKLLDQGIFKILDNKWLRDQHDGAFLHLNGPTAFTTDSFVVSPTFFPGGNIGDLAVNGTVNDLAMCGAVPRYLSLGFILEEGLMMDELWEILLAIRQACTDAGVEVVTGDTKVVEKGKGDKIFINTTGLGLVHPQAAIHHSHVQAGDKILVSGHVATHGIAIMSVRQGLEFETDIVSDTTNLNHLVTGLLDAFGTQLRFLRDPTRGGVATVLNEIARQTRLGVSLEQTAIPVLEQVDSACEMLGLDPLYVANEGIFLAFVAADAADAALAQLQNQEKGRFAAIIGEVTTDHPGQVVLRSRIGGRRIVGMLPGEQLPRIC